MTKVQIVLQNLTDFLQYTKLWVEKVNRGGLFSLNNDNYMLFRAMELAVCQVLEY